MSLENPRVKVGPWVFKLPLEDYRTIYTIRTSLCSNILYIYILRQLLIRLVTKWASFKRGSKELKNLFNRRNIQFAIRCRIPQGNVCELGRARGWVGMEVEESVSIRELELKEMKSMHEQWMERRQNLSVKWLGKKMMMGRFEGSRVI